VTSYLDEARNKRKKLEEAPSYSAYSAYSAPERGTQVRLERVELPEVKLVSPAAGGQSNSANNERGRWLRSNRARTTWRIVHLDGTKTGSGLFVDQEFAIAYAAEHGWEVQP
jgi:hypothetical protein